MKKRIAITGGRGRLAGVAAAYFREQGYEITLFSRAQGEGFQAMHDLFEPNILSSFQVLIHAAWSTVPFSSETDPGREDREDVPLIKNILESCHHIDRQQSVPKFIFLSSASVYGNQIKQPATESSLCKPLSNYARAKFFVERLILQAAAHDPRLKPVIFRMTNLIGIPSNSSVPQGIVPKIVEAAKCNQVVELWGSGKSSKDYLWIDDFLEGLKAAIEGSVEGIFNLGSGKNFSLLDFIKLAEEMTQQSLAVNYHPAYSWDVHCAKISSKAFSQATGWKAQTDIANKIRGLFQ